LAKRLEQLFPEKRLFLKSDDSTRFVRLGTSTQVGMIAGTAVLLGWTALASSLVIFEALGSGSAREQALREQQVYSERLNALSEERDARLAEAVAAQERFTLALKQVSNMQTRLLESEERRAELENAVAAVQSTLHSVIEERDLARARADEAVTELADTTGSEKTNEARIRDLEATLGFLTAALGQTAETRDTLGADYSRAMAEVEELLLTAQLSEERNDRIFQTLEEAVSVSVEPLEEMFRQVGLSPDRIINEVRRGYTGEGGPLVAPTLSTRGLPQDELSFRTQAILAGLDRLNLHRIAVDKLPFAMPVKSNFRFTSPFGYRRDPKGAGTRMHKGTDFAAPLGTPIHSTAEGVVVEARWHRGFGRMVRIKHAFGYETVYAHMTKLRVKEGQRVSRGDRIGDMGSTGRSTGVHLHYEVHESGKPVNPMTFIRAGKDVL
jgi:murein DD-endopeptidase MepM/ murein hydrolase activator NlpD